MYLKGRLARVVPLSVVLSMAAFVPLPGEAKLTAAQISKIVDDSKILGSDSEVQAAVHEGDKEAVVSAARNSKATDKDCKIDAVLIAKKIIDADPAGVTRVKVTFFDQSDKNNYRQVTVREVDVKAFAARVISQETLLDDLELVVGHGNPSLPVKSPGLKGRAPEVVPGIFHDERAELSGQIQNLQSRGVGVSPFLAQFSQIEEKVKQGDEAGVTKSLQFLTDAVNQQSEQLKKIQEQKRLQESERYNRMRERRRAEDGNGADHPQKAFGRARKGGPQNDDWERDEREEMLKKVQSKLGDLAPVPGPSPMRRMRAAFKMKEFRDSGSDVSGLMSVWQDVQRLAANGDKQGMNSRLQVLENALGMTGHDEEHHHHHHHSD